MADSTNQVLADRKIDNAAMSRRFEAKLQDEVDTIINVHLLRIKRIVQRGASRRATLSSIKFEGQRFAIRLGTVIEPQLRRFAVAQGVFERDSLDVAIGGLYRIARSPVGELSNLVRTAGLRDNRVLRQHFVSISLGEGERIITAIRNGLAAARPTEEIATSVAVGGSARITRMQARAIVRTAITTLSTLAADRVYEANSDVLRGYQYVATLDGRTTPICARNDGRVFSFDADYRPKPPLHWNCRSTTIPVVKRFSTVDKGVIKRSPSRAQRAAIDGPTAARETYEEWLRRQPLNTQIRHLETPDRARLFREGNLSLPQFSATDGELLSIERLEKLNSQAIRDAGDT